ncbi:DNA polymerase IV [Candidatus Peribacteria bacterium]|nr:DNA polymerase IV [Candidatus Peribacteria bacterium]
MISHIDADAFFASAIVRKNPHLGGKPLLALGMGGGCVIAASYEAKAFGVKTGMRLKDALVLCPKAVHVPADFHEAARASHEIEAILQRLCPLVQQMSIDEWYLDLHTVTGGLPHDLEAWARLHQNEIHRKVGLTVSVGIGPSKILAKMAGEYRKPAGVTVVTLPLSPSLSSEALAKEEGGRGPGGGGLSLETFLRDRPAGAIPGVGRQRMIHTEARGWKTAWDFAQAPTEELKKLFGKPGVELQQELLGTIVSEVTSDEAPPKSVSRCRSFRPTKRREILWAHLLRHAEYLMLKMRRHALMCRGISVWMRDGEYKGYGSNASLPQPTQTLDAILPFVRQCFEKGYDPRITYTQIALAFWQLVPSGATQYSLFESAVMNDRDEAIQKSLDALHERFGRSSITRGSAMGVKTGTAVTMDLSVYG